jgi:hypothetical protein
VDLILKKIFNLILDFEDNKIMNLIK